jgi:hypothetical protein
MTLMELATKMAFILSKGVAIKARLEKEAKKHGTIEK